MIRTAVIILTLVVINAQAQTYAGPVPRPTEGYGSDGPHGVATVSFDNPAFTGHTIDIHYPSDTTGPFPTIFYNHAFGGNDPDFVKGLFDFIAEKGYAVVFVPYQTTGVTVPERYSNLLNGFLLAVQNHPEIIDTTQVGFMGWSFGGGACFANAYHCFTQRGWGEQGRFIYALAQWYSYNITDQELGAFPANTKLIIEVFDDDSTNDHRLAVDIFTHIGVPDSAKDFVLLKSSTVDGYDYVADHGVPNTSRLFNALDYYGIYRLLDALCDYVFNHNAAARPYCLGDGSPEQSAMPAGLLPLEESDAPLVVHPESQYLFPCSDPANERREYCAGATNAESPAAVNAVAMKLSVSPNPFSSSILIRVSNASMLNSPVIRIFDLAGRQVFQATSSSLELAQGLVWNSSNLPGGLYLVRIENLSVTLSTRAFSY